MKKTIVFFPIEIGVAHISRSLAVAEELHKRGHNVFFAFPKRKWYIFKSSPVKFIEVKSLLDKDSLMNVSKLVNKDYLVPYIKEEYELLRSLKADCAVIDFRLSALVAAKALDIPIVNIAGSSGLPYSCYFPNPQLHPYLHKMVSPLLQKLISDMKINITMSLLKHLKEYGKEQSFKGFFQTMKYIVPEESHYLPYRSKKLDISYSGPLAWRGFKSDPLPTFKKSKQKTIYISFGGTGFDGNKLKQLSRRLIDLGYRVIVSSSTIVDPKEFFVHQDLIVKPFVDGRVASQMADVVVCHGGYGTMCDAIAAGKPIVAIPFNPDQLLHTFRFQELGLCASTLNFSFSFITDFFKMNWKRFQDLGSDVKVEKVIQKLDEVINNYEVYKLNIKKNQYLFDDKNALRIAADGVESMAN